MLKLTVEVLIDEPTGMQAAAALRRAFLSSTVDVRSYTIREIEIVQDHSDAQLSLLEAVG